MLPGTVSNTPITRRDFLKTAGITAGAVTLACAGAGCAAQDAPGQAAQAAVQVDTPTYNYLSFAQISGEMPPKWG